MDGNLKLWTLAATVLAVAVLETYGVNLECYNCTYIFTGKADGSYSCVKGPWNIPRPNYQKCSHQNDSCIVMVEWNYKLHNNVNNVTRGCGQVPPQCVFESDADDSGENGGKTGTDADDDEKGKEKSCCYQDTSDGKNITYCYRMCNENICNKKSEFPGDRTEDSGESNEKDKPKCSGARPESLNCPNSTHFNVLGINIQTTDGVSGVTYFPGVLLLMGVFIVLIL